MNSLHSVCANLVTMGMLYGWRIDAMLISGLLWAGLTAVEELRSAAPLRLAVHRV